MGRVLGLYITQPNSFNKRVTRVYFVLAGWPANDPFFNHAGSTHFISCGFQVVLSGRVGIDSPKPKELKKKIRRGKKTG